MADANEDYESYLKRTIAEIQEQFHKAAEPYVRKLVEIYALKPPSPMIICAEQAQAMGLFAASEPVAALQAQQGDVVSTDELSALLPGVYYMDPPDGGSVTVLEQVRRMAEDAARYRWLRDKANDPPKGMKRDPMVFRCHPEHELSWSDAVHSKQLDAAIDAAMLAARREG